MTINQMVDKMTQNYNEIMEIRREVKYKQKHLMEVFDRIVKACDTMWAYKLQNEVVGNKRKAEVERLLKSSEITLNRVRRIKTRFNEPASTQ